MLSTLVPVAALLAAPTADSDIELYDYTVKKGDSCASIAKRMFGSRKAYDKIHEHNPGMGPTPHKLKPGTILRLPREVKKPDAQVTATERKVEARAPKDTSWKAANQGFELFRGWRVSTLERAFAEVTFRDESRIYMRENTLVIIYGGSEGSARRTSTTAKLDRGALRSRLGELSGGKGLSVETPSASADLTGGSALITVDDEGTARVANHGGGEASVKSKSGKRVKVPALQGSKVKKGKAPTPPRPLPPTPMWAADNATAFVIPAGATGSVEGSWGKVEKAQTYRVEVGRMAQGGFVMTSVVVPKTATSFEMHGLASGEYFATVAAIDDDAFESPPSRLFETQVIEAGFVAPTGAAVAVPPGKEGEPAAPVRVLPGAKLDAPSDLMCALGDDVLADEVIVTGNGLQQFRCQDAKGRAVPGFKVDVVGVTVANADDGGGTFTIRREDASTLDLALASEAELPTTLSVRAPEGFEVGALARNDAGQWTVPVTAGKDAPDTATFELVVEQTTVSLASFDIKVVDPDAPLPTEDPVLPRERDTHMVELGVYGGFISMSTNHELVTTDAPLATNRRIARISPDVGVRFGYYPLRTFGVELEGGLMPTSLREGSDVLLFEGRASLIGQLPMRVTPYMLVGGGVTGLTSDADVLGDDTDASFHWGGGVKFFATKNIAFRLGIRDVVLATSNDQGSSHSPQVLLGISGVLRRTSAKERK